MRPVDSGSSSPTLLPGLWSELNKKERERIAAQVQAKKDTLSQTQIDHPGQYVNQHADEFLPGIKLSDLTPAAQKRVKAAMAKGADLQTAIAGEATARFDKRYKTAQTDVAKAIKTVTKSDPVLAKQLSDSKARLAAAKTPEERLAAIHDANHLLRSVPGHEKNMGLDVSYLKADDANTAGASNVSSMGTLYSTAKAIDQAGNNDGKVTNEEALAYGMSLQDPAQLARVEKVAKQLGDLENGAGSLAELIDSRARVGGDGKGGGGKLIGNQDGKLSLQEVNDFIKEIKSRKPSDTMTAEQQQQLIDDANNLRLRFIKP